MEKPINRAWLSAAPIILVSDRRSAFAPAHPADPVGSYDAKDGLDNLCFRGRRHGPQMKSLDHLMTPNRPLGRSTYRRTAPVCCSPEYRGPSAPKVSSYVDS